MLASLLINQSNLFMRMTRTCLVMLMLFCSKVGDAVRTFEGFVVWLNEQLGDPCLLSLSGV